MGAKVKVFYDPTDQRKIIVKSPRGYQSSFLIVRENGKIRVIEEKAKMAVHRMERPDIMGLASHLRWAKPKAGELALQGLLL